MPLSSRSSISLKLNSVVTKWRKEWRHNITLSAVQRWSWKQLPLYRANYLVWFQRWPRDYFSKTKHSNKIISKGHLPTQAQIRSQSPLPQSTSFSSTASDKGNRTAETWVDRILCSVRIHHHLKRIDFPGLIFQKGDWCPTASDFREYRIPGVHGTKESRDDFLAFFPAGFWGVCSRLCQVAAMISHILLSLFLHYFTLDFKVEDTYYQSLTTNLLFMYYKNEYILIVEHF